MAGGLIVSKYMIIILPHRTLITEEGSLPIIIQELEINITTNYIIHDISTANQFNGENLEVYYNVINGVHSPTWRLGYGTGISVQDIAQIQNQKE